VPGQTCSDQARDGFGDSPHLDKGRVVFSGPAPRAARHYLYGESARDVYLSGIARFTSPPPRPIEVRPGEDLRIAVEAEILVAAEVGCVFVIERLQPGFGWETALMSRAPASVGSAPGRYAIDIAVPHLPLDPGAYQMSLHLMMADPEMPDRRVALDGWSWLNGDGLALQVTGDSDAGLDLPLRWRIEAAETVQT